MRKREYYLFLTTISTFLSIYSCTNRDVQSSNMINGTWESIGCGYVIEIKGSTTYNLYNINSIACLPSKTGTYKEIISSLKITNDTLILKEGTTLYSFKRIKALPPTCAIRLDTLQSMDPIFNFEFFAETINEHYAFMELNNIRWAELYEQQKSKLLQNPTDINLYLIIEETLKRINDNHAFLEATDEIYESIDMLITEDEISSELPEYGDLPIAEEVANHHLDSEMTKDSWLIQWGKMTDDIGYIQVKTMWLYADLDIPQQLIDSIGFVDAYIETRDKMYGGDYIKKEVEGVRTTMDKVMRDLRNSEAIVIDMRFNGGGQDAVSCEILRNFSDQRTHIWTQNFKYGDLYTSEQKVFLEKSDNAFTKPVYVLTSPKTGSAAECFSLATMEIGHIKRIGDRTDGAMSTTLDKILPNGWIFSISNQILMDIDGTAYENIGVPVDFEIDYPDDIQSFFRSVINDLDKDKQDILNAIEALKNGK